MRVFIADDNVPFRSRLASILGGIQGIEIVGEAGDVQETVKAIRHKNADVLILDIHMPGGSGLDVLAAAKAARRAPIVIMLTVGPRSEYQTESYLLGADYFFEKSSELRRMGNLLKRIAKRNILAQRAER
jgi:two-component system, NarL family, response regulator DevR